MHKLKTKPQSEKAPKANTQTDCCDNPQTQKEPTAPPISRWKPYQPAFISALMLGVGLLLDQWQPLPFYTPWVRFTWYALAFLPVGWPVMRQGWRLIKKGDFFTEFSLMSLATLGAFVLREYPEAVAVMLFYTVGELFQGAAVRRARGNIQELLDVRPKDARVFRNGNLQQVSPEQVSVGERIQVRKGEKIPLDGQLLSAKALVDTAAITGESTARVVRAGEALYAGSINLDAVIEIKVDKAFKDSTISRMLELVQHAASRKSNTEQFIRRFAKIYTPIVFFLALALALLPYFFVSDYQFSDWLYRALVFLVISCPCALVISIPLGYFGGLGAASRNGILFKGGTFLDAITQVDTVVMDKTGTLTEGTFKIREIVTQKEAENHFMGLVMGLEQQATHPIAQALLQYELGRPIPQARDVTEVSGKGIHGVVEDQKVYIGNRALLLEHHIQIPDMAASPTATVVYVAIHGAYAGYIALSDQLKPDAQEAISRLRAMGVSQLGMLSGDKKEVVAEIAQSLQLDWAHGELLPEQKMEQLEAIKQKSKGKVAFMGDGINDAAVLASSDIGIAMGGLGSDLAVETADVVIQSDRPGLLPKAIQIGKATRRIVWQNIALAFGVKIAVLTLGAWGVASLWEAVFADVGVALLAVLNAVRLQRMQWN